MNEIEEMSKDICLGCKTRHKCDKDGCAMAEIVAEALCNAGYGKVEDYKKEIERLNKDLEYYQKENDRLYTQKRDLEDQMIENGWAEYVNDKVLTLKDSKQQAIKEFAEKLLKHYPKRTDKYLTLDDAYMLDVIYGLLKEHGISK